MNRRAFPRAAAASAAVAATSRCRHAYPADLLPGDTAPAGCAIPPVRATAEREIRTVAGLRPFRPSGFVVRPERIGDLLVIHNYGHGGAGRPPALGAPPPPAGPLPPRP